jgi:glycosyltransferase involved in cell wall biosynthesis
MTGRPVRACLVGPSLDILGGQAVAVQRLLARLREQPGVDVSFLAVNPRLPGPLRLLQRVKYVRTVVTSIAYVGSLLLRAWRYDVLHAFSASYWSFLLAPTPAIVIGRLFGRTVVLNYRSGEAGDHLQRHGWIAVPIMRLASVIVVPSEYLVGVFAQHGLKARTILNFIETERYAYREREPVSPVLFGNRNLEPLYGVDDLIRAFGRVQDRFSAASLTLVGDGSQRPALEGLVGSLGLRHVTFVGRIPPEWMPDYYAGADIYVNASRIDNMPQSILEAYSSGTPVVTTDAGGIPFIVRNGETGLMVPVGDWTALGDAVIRLLDDPSLAVRLARAGPEVCLERYAGGPNIRQWVALYQALAAVTRS